MTDLGSIPDEPLQRLPTDLASLTIDEEKFSQLEIIVEAAQSDGSIYAIEQGFYQIAPEFLADPEMWGTVFAPGTLAAIVLLVRTRMAFDQWRRNKVEDRTVDSKDQKTIQEIIHTVNSEGAKAIPYIKEHWREDLEASPISLVCDALLKHLEGKPDEGNISFVKFEKLYPNKSAETKALVNFRFGKSLSAVGKFNEAGSYFLNAVNSDRLSNLIRAQAARELCNGLTQHAWEKPRNAKGWNELIKMTEHLGGLIADSRADLQPQSDELEFLAASCEEYSILAKAGGDPSPTELEEISRNLESQLHLKETTAQNRHTQLAACYLRAGDPLHACSIASQFENDKDRGDLELALNQVVKALAYEKLYDSDKAKEAIEKADRHLSNTRTSRFRRVVRFIHSNLDPDTSTISKFGSYLWEFYGPARNVKAFVPELPHLRI